MIDTGPGPRMSGRWRFERALIFDRARGALEILASIGRVVRIRMFHPGVEITFGTSIGPGVTLRCAPGSTIRLAGVAVGRGAHLETAPGAVMELAGRSIGAGAILVARERITMRPGSVLAEATVVRDADQVLRGMELSDGLFRCAPVVIGREACILSRAIVLRGVTVGDRAVVGAGAVVITDVEPGSMVGGVPARPIAARPDRPGVAAPLTPTQRAWSHADRRT
ncbi:MAG: acyltransferase [Frankia sp.]